jgi:peroxiredoxin family protein
LWRFVKTFCRGSTIQISRTPTSPPYVETYLKNLRGAVKKGAFKTWYDFLRELKLAHGDRFKICACPHAAHL